MKDGLTISIEKRDARTAKAIDDALIAFNRDRGGQPDPQHINILLRDSERNLRGGIVAVVGFDVLYIDNLWVEEARRGGDYGTKLMKLAEDEGRRRGAVLAWVDTYSWQARPFYEKLGYRLFGELPYAGGKYARYFLRKDL